MKGFLRRISPRGAIMDLLHVWRAPNPHRWQVLGVSVAATFAMMVVFLPDSQRVPPAKPKVTWITTFAPGRSDAEIVASNEANQRVQDERRAEAAAREERRKEAFRALGRATGLDVNELERQYSEDSPPAEAPAAQRSNAASGE